VSTQNVFMCMNPGRIVSLIQQAQSRIVYINSGVNEEIASALNIKAVSIGKGNVSVIMDLSESVCRFGYGTALGFSHLHDGGIDIQRVDNLRIGCLVIDNKGWVFTPTPLLLEADRSIDAQPNAIKVTTEQILKLINTTAPKLMKPEEKKLVNDDTEKLVTDSVSVDDIEELTVKLEKNPPQKFDISRKVNVFNTLIEFVELRLEGCSVGRQTVSIPTKLLVGSVDKSTQKQLKTGYKVLGSKSDLTGKALNEKVEDIRKGLTRSIHNYGRVALKSKRTELEKAVEDVRCDIKEFQKDLNNKLQAELNEQKKNLIDALSPAIKENPPQELLWQIEESKPSKEQAEMYLDMELTKIFPRPEELIKDMKLYCIFKGVTYESLCDETFQQKVQECYPMLAWDRLFNEFDVIRAEN